MATEEKQERSLPRSAGTESDVLVALPDTPQWIYEMAERYGEPTISLDELRYRLEKELGGVSLSESLMRDREKNPY